MKPASQPLHRRRRLLGCLVSPLLCGFMLVCLYSGIDIRADPIRDQLGILDAARTLWAAQRISHYRMLVKMGTCQHEVEALNEKVVQTYQNTCQEPDVTVSALFDRIADEITNIQWANYPCDFLAIHATLDPVRGYPTRIDYKQESASPANIGGFAYIAAHPLGRLSIQPCTLLGFGRLSTVVESLVPLP